MAGELGWGILGTARINQMLIPPLQSSRLNRIWAIASRDQSRAEAYAREWSIPRAYGSYEDLLADPQIQVVYISLPNSLHAEWTIKAAYAGKHVLCEKPLALDVIEVDAITEAAKQNKIIVQEAFKQRHMPQTLKVEEMVRSGVIDNVWLVRGAFRFPLSLNGTADIRLDPILGGGCLWDVGCYPLNYARMLLQAEPVQVTGWQLLGESGVDLSFAGQLRFPDNAVAQIDSSFISPYRAFMEIAGSKGSLFIPTPFNPNGETSIWLQRGTQEEEIRFPAFNPYSGEVEDMANAILVGTAPRVSLTDSRANVATIVALLQSASKETTLLLE
jgi:predicted dehydrogenase